LKKYIYILFGIVILSQSALFAQEKDYNYYLEQLNQARESKDFERLADAYYQIGIFEEERNRNSEKSFEFLSRALEYYKFLNDTTGEFSTRYHIANHLFKNNMLDDARNEYEQLKEHYNSNKNERLSALVELNLFNLNLEDFDIAKAKQSLDLTKVYLDSIQNSDLEIRYLINQIKYYEYVQELDTALVMANECVELSKFNTSQLDKTVCLARRGDIQMKLNNFQGAIRDYLAILPELKKIPYSTLKLEVFKNLAFCYSSLSLYKNANFFLNQHSVLQDSILNENRIIALNNLTYKHQNEKKSAEIKLLEKDKAYAQQSNQQQKRAITILGIAFAVLLLGLYYIVSFYREKIKTANIIEKQNDKISKQKIKELKDEIQINSMQSMLTGQEIERERIAKDLHDSLGGLLSTIKLQVDNIQNKDTNSNMAPEYKKATRLLDVAVSEVRAISQNLQPGALSSLGLLPALNDLINRYDIDHGPEIVFQHFDIPPKLDQMVALGIYRIVQEILTNAIRHSKAKEILVQLIKEDSEIAIHIEDDGIGFDTNQKFKSMGLENIKSRVNYLKGSMEIDSRPNEGTSFLIHVKYNLK